MTRKIQIIFLSLFLMQGSMISAQNAITNYPLKGYTSPDFTLTDINYFDKQQATLKDFKGKWLIMDFWTTGCSACVASFPKINRLQKLFKDSVQFLLIGKNDRKWNRNIKSMFEKIREHHNLDLSIAYDSLLFKQFGITSVPHVIIIDPDSKVYAIINGGGLSEENLYKILNREDLSLSHKYNRFELDSRKNVNITQPLLIDGNGGKDDNFIYRFILANWDNEERQAVLQKIDAQVDAGQFQVTGVSLRWLYNYAYFGVNDWWFGDSLYQFVNKEHALEIDDSTLFKSSYGNGTGLYTVSLIVPKEKASKAYFQKILQQELKNIFGYEVKIETRSSNYWKLTASKSARENLKTTNEIKSVEGDHAGISMKNVPIKNLLSSISGYHGSLPNFFDETGITGNIDIDIDAVMTDLNDIQKSLSKNGLQLTKGKKKMKVLVIRDPKGKFHP